MKAKRETKAQKGARLLKLLRAQVGDDSGQARIVAALNVRAHAFTWTQIATAANNLGWTIEEVLEELCDRYIEELERDLKEDKEHAEAYKKSQAEKEPIRFNLN